MLHTKYIKIPLNLIVYDSDVDESEFDEDTEEEISDENESDDDAEISKGDIIKLTRMNQNEYLHLDSDMNNYLLLNGVMNRNVFRGIMADKNGNMIPQGTLIPIEYVKEKDIESDEDTEGGDISNRIKSVTMVRAQFEDPLNTGLKNIDHDKDRMTRELQLYLYFKIIVKNKKDLDERDANSLCGHLINELFGLHDITSSNCFSTKHYKSGKAETVYLALDYRGLFKLTKLPEYEIVDEIPLYYLTTL